MNNIKKSGFAKLHGVEHTSTGAETLTAITVWKDHNPEKGIFTKSIFIPFLKSLRTEDYDHTEELFKLLRLRLKLSNSLRLRKDRGDQLYYWANFVNPMAQEGTKVIGHPELLELIKQYREGKVLIDFDMDDLIDVGLSED